MQRSDSSQQVQQAAIDLQAGRFETAAKALIPIVKSDPENFVARQHLAQAYYGLGYFEEAVEAFRPNFDKSPEVVEKYTYFGNLCLSAGLSEEATAHFKKANEIQPGNPHILSAIGQSYVPIGDFKAAETYLLKALKLERKHIRSLVILADISPDKVTPDQKKILSETLADQASHPGIRVDAGFAYGALLQRDKKFEDAFTAFETSNGLAGQIFAQGGAVFDLAQEQKRYEGITSLFTKDFLKQAPKADESVTPVFIIGLPRSGTTLVEQIIASHSKVFASGEQKTLGELQLRMEHIALQGLNEAKKDILDRIKVPWRAEYFERMHLPRDKGYTHTTDKMPLNFPYVGAAGYAFAHAKVIILRRHPFDNCLSMYFKPLTNSYPASVSLTKLGQYYSLFEHYAAHWENALDVFSLSYEELVKDQEGVSRKLFKYLGLAWEDACLKFHEQPGAVRTMSTVQVRKPITDKYIGQWKHYKNHLKPLKQALDKNILARYGLDV